MEIKYKRLRGAAHSGECQKLMNQIWGLTDLDVMSGVTLASIMADDSMGLVAGAFEGDRMIGVFVVLPTMEPGVVYGHMVGVLDGYRGGVGAGLMRFGFEELARCGARVMTGVFEPLESRNANLYLNKLGARAVRYVENYYRIDCDMHRGMPMDRLCLRFPLSGPETPPKFPQTLDQALERYPVARDGDLPDAQCVLVEIPGGLEELKAADPEQARGYRFRVRRIMGEYLNRRGYAARRLYAGPPNGRSESLYLLHREAN